MATIGDVTQAASYTGNAAIGGAIDAPIVIDPSPVQRFATFQYYSNQAKWQQKQIDDATAAKQIANISAYDINSPLTPYSDALKSKLKDIQDYTRANPNALVYGRDPQGYQELNKKINEFGNLRQSATASDAVYAANKNAIDTEPDLNKKSYLQSDLDTRVKELFDGGVSNAQNKILASSSPLKPDDFKIPEVQLTKYDAITQLPNSDVINEFTFINPKQGMANSELVAAGFNKPMLDENTEAFKRLSPERQELERQRNKLSGIQRQQILDTTNSFNSLLGEYKTANPDVDITQIKGSLDGNTLTDIIKSANGYNDQIKELNNLIAAGRSKDKTGKIITDQFDLINVQDGLSTAELIFMQSLQTSKSPIWSLNKNIQQTDNALQASAQAETAAYHRGQLALDRGALKLKEDEWKAKTAIGGETVKNSALEKAKRIYNDLSKLADAQGVISPDKVRQLNAEQLKYLGTEVVEQNANTGISKSSFQPLDLTASVTKSGGILGVGKKENKSEYAVELTNGEIRVLKNAKYNPDTKRYGGEFENTKSTNILNVATNILNEELKTAGSKELNSYTAIDLGDLSNGSTTNNTTTVTTSESSKTFDKTKLSPIVKNGVTYYVDPTTRKVFDKDGKPMN